MLEVFGDFEQRGFQRTVSGLGMKGRPMEQQLHATRMACSLGVRGWSGNFQSDVYAERRLGFRLMFENYVGGIYCRQAAQLFDLFVHTTVPGGLGVETEIANGGFHICSGLGLHLQLVSAGGWHRQPSNFA